MKPTELMIESIKQYFAFQKALKEVNKLMKPDKPFFRVHLNMTQIQLLKFCAEKGITIFVLREHFGKELEIK